MRFWIACAIAFAVGPVMAQEDSDSDPYSLVLAPIDLTDATRAMTIYDRDEDGFIAEKELERLSWRDQVGDYDLNRDKKITHLELAVRSAKIRAASGVEQKHVNNAKLFLNRHDENGNGQLDPKEIAKGWPDEPEEFDKNRDGVITLNEMAIRFAFMAGYRREMGIEQVDQVTAIRMVRRFDEDKDGKLAGDERHGAFLPLPVDQFDEDSDGQLAIIEVATMVAKYRRQRGMSPSDLQTLRTVFATHDSNADGTIDEAEYDKAEKTGRTVTLQALDSDKSKTLTYKEVADSLASNRKGLGFDDSMLAEARKLLIRHDDNKDLHISESELADIPQKGELPKTLLKTCDKDKDGKISILELATHLSEKNR